MLKSILFSLLLPAAGLLSAAAFDEKSELLLYADFEKSAAPSPAIPGATLVKSDALQFAPGKSGRGIHFDKTTPGQELRYRLGRELDSRQGWSIAFWLKPDDANASNRDSYSYLFRTDATGQWGDGVLLAAFSRWNSLRLERFNANRKSVSAQCSSSIVPGGKWTHFALVCQAGRIALFINGEPVTLTGQETLDQPGTPQRFIRLGAIDRTIATRFKGTIDELKIFKRDLNASEVKLIMDSHPGSNDPTRPVLQIPFNGRLDAVSAAGPIQSGMENVAFRPAVVGKGAELIRHGYDRAGRVTLSEVAAVNGPEVTVSLFFIPRAFDGNKRGLVAAGDTWRLFRQGKVLTWQVGARTLAVDISSWKPGVPIHLAAAASAQKMFVALDGKIAAEAPGVSFKGPGKSSLVIGDLPERTTYSLTQADGVLDEVRIFDTVLTAKEISAEINRRNDPAAGDDLDRWSIAPKPASPKELPLWALDGAERIDNACRSEISLNALWRFQLAMPGEKPAAAHWRYFPLPGRYAGHGNGLSDHIFLLRDANLKPLGETFLWNGVPGYKLSESYWERKLELPAAWGNRHFELSFDDFSAETARLFLNGKYIAQWEGATPHTIPIPREALRFGTPNDLQLLLSGASHRWAWRGVKGNLTLRVLSDAVLSDPFLIPSVRNRNYTVRATLANRGKTPQKLRLRVDIAGRNAPRPFFSAPQTLQPGESREFTAVTPWANAELWSHLTPYLYQVTLKAVDGSDAVRDELPPIRSGFREFRIDGKNYKLNEKTVHLFNTDEWVNFASSPEQSRLFLRELKKRGYNCIRLSFSMKDNPMPALFDIADEEGILLLANAQGVSGPAFSLWNAPEVRAKLAADMRRTIAAWRNHPSLVMWYLSVNFLGYPLDYHPLKMADGYLPDANRAKFEAAAQGAEILLANDPTRPYFYQAGGAYGPVLNANAYFCWWPQAERRAWAEEWRAIGTKPLHIIETSFPYVLSLTGMDRRFSDQSRVLLIHENTARYLGNDAYDASQPIVNRYVENSRAGKKFFSVTLSSEYRNFRKFAELREFFLRDTIPHWRASGISGICPFAEFPLAYQSHDVKIRQLPADYRRRGPHPDILKSKYQVNADFTRPLPLADALRDVFAPRLALIAGAADSPTDTGINAWCGEPLARTLILMNDTLENARFKGELRFAPADGKTAAPARPVDEVLAPGEIRRLPFAVTPDRVGDWRLEAVLDQVRSTPVVLSVHAKPVAVTHGKIALFDPEKCSRADFELLGTPPADAARLTSLNGVALLVIGKNALGSPALANWAKKVNLPAAKLNILILEQEPARLRTLGFRTGDIDARNVFKISPASFPASLNDRMLSNWHGRSTLAPHRQEPPQNAFVVLPEQLWRWNTLNTVASAPIRRTGEGRTVSLLSCGMDLAYSALLEVATPNGMVVLSQMELSGRTRIEPAAAQLLAALLARYSRPCPVAKPEAEYLGKLTPEQCRQFGLTATRGKSHSFTVTEAGKTLLGDLSRRDLFFASPLSFDAYSGEGVTPLLQPAAVIAFERNGKRYLASGWDLSILEKRLAETRQISLALSDYWAQHVMQERIQSVASRLRGDLSPAIASAIAAPRMPDDVLDLNGEWQFRTDLGKIGIANRWFSAPPSQTRAMNVPGYWETQGVPGYDGAAWYFKRVKLPPALRGRELYFTAQMIDDLDEVYCNGVSIGATGSDVPGYWVAPRRYRIARELTAGRELFFAVRVTDLRGNGGMNGDTALRAVNHDAAASGDFPYRDATFPTYQTESAIRW